MFHDNWIPGDIPTKAVPRNLENLDDSTVSAIIDLNTRDWNLELLDYSIVPFVVQKIKAILLCRTPQEGCVVWPQSRSGLYTVRMGYQLLCELENREGASSSNLVAPKIFWNGIWKLKIPNKKRIFC